MSIKSLPSNTKGNGINKVRRPFGDPVSYPMPNPRFVPIPSNYQIPAGNLEMDLKDIVGATIIKRITNAQKIVFHTVGDTGPVNGEQAIHPIALQMENQIANEKTDGDKPSFFYHLGDVVYFNGLVKDYEHQFYDAYKHYPAKIVAIPGNHDCDTSIQKGDPPDNEPSLTGFMENFCDTKSRYHQLSPYRKSMNQPWPYWKLTAPFATILGLFSNVDGSLDKKNNDAQYKWLVAQLKIAPKNICLIIAIHHPCFSLDSEHGGYPDILEKLDEAFKEAARCPAIIFSGHVHNYQRFTRIINNKEVPYIIAGNGGYANDAKAIHQLQKNLNTATGDIPFNFQTTRTDLVLAKYNTTDPGFLKITIDKQYLLGEYFTNNFEGNPPSVNPFEQFKLDWVKGKLLK
jgi:hypothetical protein